MTLDGTRVSRATWAGDGKPRVSGRDFAAHEVRHAYDKEVRKQMAAGFVFLRAEADAVPGQLVLDCLAPGGGASDAFDLRPDGGEIAVGVTLKDAYGAEIHLIDVATGERRLVHAEPVGAGRTFTVVHAVRYDADGTGLVYALNGETRRLDLESGATSVLAAYEQWKSASFNPYCVRPMWDDARRRLLVFDAGDMVRVLDADGSVRLEVPTKADTTECRAGALSPSGRLLALYRPSRGVVYRHSDAVHDATNEIEVWDVAAGRLAARVAVPAPLREKQLHEIGFDPTESLIVANPDPVQGPCALSIDTGELAWHFPDARQADHWGTCFTWAYGPSGGPLAIGRWHDDAVDLRDPATREPWPGTLERLERHRVKRIAFSRDGRLMAAGGDGGRLTLRKIAV